MFRRPESGLEVLLVHPGGPFSRAKLGSYPVEVDDLNATITLMKWAKRQRDSKYLAIERKS